MTEHDKARLNALLDAARDIHEKALADPEKCVIAEVAAERVAHLESQLDPVRH